MTESELTSYGWHKNTRIGGCMIWCDPENLLSHYTFRNAVNIQKRRLAGRPVPKPGTPEHYLGFDEGKRLYNDD